MELDHEFTVPVPVDQAWSVLLDVERIAPCMPGATLDAIEGDEQYRGRMKVKVGAMTITYRGTVKIAAADEASHEVTLEASAKEARGSGTAAATVRAVLHEEGGATRVAVRTELNVTGRPAQFGRNILGEVGAKIITRFATNLAAEIETPAAAPAPPKAQPGPEPGAGAGARAGAEPRAKPEAAPAEPEPAAAEVPQPPAAPAEPRTAPPAPAPPARDDDAVDLLEFAGPSLAKRAVPALGALVVLLLAIRFLTRRRRRG